MAVPPPSPDEGGNSEQHLSVSIGPSVAHTLQVGRSQEAPPALAHKAGAYASLIIDGTPGWRVAFPYKIIII